MNNCQHRSMNQASASQVQTQRRFLNSSLGDAVGIRWILWVGVSSDEVQKDVLDSPAALLPPHPAVPNQMMQGQKDITEESLVLIKNPASFSTRWTPRRIVATHPRADGI
ncbi:hypothetical protein TNCV_4154391 [Trichonephila clavipes]|nr:hypothetical protein TNCV_4154391 [Trichonephila clavipes]